MVLFRVGHLLFRLWGFILRVDPSLRARTRLGILPLRAGRTSSLIVHRFRRTAVGLHFLWFRMVVMVFHGRNLPF
jgi:hypothetical protein